MRARRLHEEKCLHAIHFRAILTPIMHDTLTIFISGIEMIRNDFAWYPGYKIFVLGFHDIRYKYLVSMIHNIYVCGIHDTHYLCQTSIIHNIYVWYPYAQ